MNDFSSLFEGKTPEEQQQAMDALMELGILDEQDSGLQEQLAQVQALQSRGAQNYGGGVAGLLGAGSDILGAVLARRRADQLRGERKGLLDKKVAGRKRYAGLFGQPQPYQEPPDVEPPQMFDDGIPEYLRRR